MNNTLAPNKVFSTLASDEQIQRATQALEANGIQTFIAENGEQARKLFFQLVPEGAQVHQSASKTMEALGITAEIEQSGKFDAVRPKLRQLDRKTQAGEMRRTGAAPDYMVGSVHAITEDGHALIASASGSQLGPYASGAGKVVWVVGAQKLVKDINEGLRRIDEYTFPLEDERAQQVYGTHSSLNKLLIINKERPGRISLIIVKENLGF